MAVAHALVALFVFLSAGLWVPAGGGPADADLAVRDDGARLTAVLALARVEPARARALLVPMLGDRDPAVRVTAARLLVRRDAPEATLAATEWVSGPLPRDRLAGLQVLREAATLTPVARRAVERALRDGDLPLRVASVDVLATHPSGDSLGALVEALDDDHRDVRVRAAHALGATKDTRAALPLLARLDDSDRLVQSQVVSALGQLGDRHVLPALLREVADPAPERRIAAIEALGELGDPAAVAALTPLARLPPTSDAARLALGQIGTPEAALALLALASDDAGGADLGAALARVGPRAVPRLVDELGQDLSGQAVARARLAAEVLGRLGDRRATAALVATVERHAPAAPVALAALERLADPTAVPALVSAARDEVAGEPRAAALRALAATGDDRALVALPRALADPDAGVRAAAVRLAGALGGPAATSQLAAHLNDADPDVRAAVALTLARSAWPSPSADIARAVIQARAAAFGQAVRDALGDVLERAVDATDAAALESAYVDAAPAARVVLARGLAAAHGGARWSNGRVADALIADLGGGDGLAPVAADALVGAALTSREQDALAIAFARAEEDVRARLAPALAQFGAGVTALAATLRDADAGVPLRAAAAWALAGAAGAGPALHEAADAPGIDAAIAANARAALALPPRRRRLGWCAVRLVAPDGGPCPHRWVTLTSRAGNAVWALTDLTGRARVAELGDGDVTVRVPPE